MKDSNIPIIYFVLTKMAKKIISNLVAPQYIFDVMIKKFKKYVEFDI